MSSKKRITSRSPSIETSGDIHVNKLSYRKFNKNNNCPSVRFSGNVYPPRRVGYRDENDSVKVSLVVTVGNHSREMPDGGDRGSMRRSKSVPPDFHRATPEMIKERGIHAVYPRAYSPVPQEDVLGRRFDVQRTRFDVPDQSQRIDCHTKCRIVVLEGERKRYGFSLDCFKGYYYSNELLHNTTEDVVMYYPTITSIIDQSPAHRAGLLPNDVITEINAINVANATLERCFELMNIGYAKYLRLKVFTPPASNNNTNNTIPWWNIRARTKPKRRTVLAYVRSFRSGSKKARKNYENEEPLQSNVLIDSRRRLSFIKVSKPHRAQSKKIRQSSFRSNPEPDRNNDVGFTSVKLTAELSGKNSKVLDGQRHVSYVRESITSRKSLPLFRRITEPMLIRKEPPVHYTSNDADTLSEQDVTIKLTANNSRRLESSELSARGIRRLRPTSRLLEVNNNHISTNRNSDLNIPEAPSWDEFILGPNVQDSAYLRSNQVTRTTPVTPVRKPESLRVTDFVRDDDSGINGSVIDVTGESDTLLCEIVKASTKESDAVRKEEITLGSDKSHALTPRIFSDHLNAQPKVGNLSGDPTKKNESPHVNLQNVILPPPPGFESNENLYEVPNVCNTTVSTSDVNDNDFFDTRM